MFVEVSKISLFPYTRVYGLCRGRCFDVFRFYGKVGFYVDEGFC
jgi:hypothetical protein